MLVLLFRAVSQDVTTCKSLKKDKKRAAEQIRPLSMYSKCRIKEQLFHYNFFNCVACFYDVKTSVQIFNTHD